MMKHVREKEREREKGKKVMEIPFK